MSETAQQRHDRLGAEMARRILTETRTLPEAMILAESLVLAIMLFHAPDPRHADEYLYSLTQAVLERMGASAPPPSSAGEA